MADYGDKFLLSWAQMKLIRATESLPEASQAKVKTRRTSAAAAGAALELPTSGRRHVTRY